MRVPPEVMGVLATTLSALFSNTNMMVSKLMQHWHWPYFFLAGSGAFIISLGLTVVMICQDAYRLERRDVKWVILRGFFGCGNNVLCVCAVLCGAHVGSVGALGSVNTVVAALLGRLVLGEPLGRLHVVAMILALAGAVLISDPVEALASMGSSLLGNALALLAGISLGCMFISSRKSGKASSQMLTTSAMAQRCLFCWCLAFIPAVPDGRFDELDPWPSMHPSQEIRLRVAGGGQKETSWSTTILWFLLLTAVLFFTNICSSLGSKLCPAALSSTWMTGVQMASGYMLDIFCFHKVPKATTVCGACMMLLAVVTMAATRLRREAPAPREMQAPELARSETKSSLVSFVASEYCEVAEEMEVLPSAGPRQRHMLPRVFGASTAAA